MNKPLRAVSLGTAGRAQDCDSRVGEARQAGYKAGYEAARKELEAAGTQQLQELRALHETVYAELEASNRALMDDIGHGLPAAIIATAEKLLVGYKPDVDTIHSLVKEALAEMRDKSLHADVLLNADDYEMLKQADALDFVPSPHVSIKPDAELLRGDCRVLTPVFELDARLSEKVDRLRQQLIGRT